MKLEFAAPLRVLGELEMTGVLTFTAIMLAGCVFLLYFLVALWRDGHKLRTGPRVIIIELTPTGERTNSASACLRIIKSHQVLDTTGSEGGFQPISRRRSSK